MFDHKKVSDLVVGDIMCNENGDILGEVKAIGTYESLIIVTVSGAFGVACNYTLDPNGTVAVCNSEQEECMQESMEKSGLSLKSIREAMDRRRMLTVSSVPYSRFMSNEDKKLVDEFNASGEKMQLQVHESYEDAPLEDILEEGMYEYRCSDDLLMERLYELSEEASPVGWTVQDVIKDTGSHIEPAVKQEATKLKRKKGIPSTPVKEAWNVGEPSNFAPNGKSYHSNPEDWKEKHEWVSAKLTAAGYKCKGKSHWNSTWTNGNPIEDISVDYWDDFDVIKEIIEMSLPIGIQTESVVKESSDLVKRAAVSFDIQTSSELSESDIEKSIKEALEQKGILVDSYMEIHTID